MPGGFGELVVARITPSASLIPITNIPGQVYKDTVATDPGFIFLLMVALYSTVALMFLALLAMLLK